MSFKRIACRLLGRPIPSLYVSRNSGITFSSTHLLLERITPETGQMLAITWDEKHFVDPARRRRLFGGMARIMLSLARIPQPRIGSFQFHDDGTISLTNRPYTDVLAQMESHGAPRVLQSGSAYTCTEPYVSDMLTFHDRGFLHDPNATYCEMDCQINLAVKATLRTLAHHYIRRESRDGPFILQHTDLRFGNIFVDDDWNVTCLVDLEWVCALPVEELAVPYWLSNRAVDGLVDEHLAAFENLRREFMLAFEHEEQQTAAHHSLKLSRIMHETWKSGGIWFWLALSCVNGAKPLIYRYIVPMFTKKPMRFREALHEFWCRGSDRVVEAKLADYKTYEAQLRKVYNVTEATEEPMPTAS